MNVLRFRNLDSFGAYCFECRHFKNLLQILKNLVCKRGKPLQQLVKRITEIEINRMVVDETEGIPTGTLTKKHSAGPLINGILEQQLYSPCSCPTTASSENKFVLIENFVMRNSQTQIVVRQFMQTKDFFSLLVRAFLALVC